MCLATSFMDGSRLNGKSVSWAMKVEDIHSISILLTGSYAGTSLFLY
jgi:hypothetical protein